MGESGRLLPGINAIEIDQGVKGVNAPESVGRITSMTDKPVYVTVYYSIKLEDPLLGKIYPAVSLLSVREESFTRLTSCGDRNQLP